MSSEHNVLPILQRITR